MAQDEKSASYSELVRIPAFLVFWFGRLISGFGDILFTMATMWYVLSTTDSALATAGVPLVPMLTFLFLSMPLGTIADRLPKKTVMVMTDLGRGLVILTVFLLMLGGLGHPFIIYIANFLLTVGDILFGPAQQAALPGILPDKERQLPVANGLLSATSSLIQLLGYGLGGAIVGLLGMNQAILLDALSFFLSACAFVFIAIPAMQSKGTKGAKGFLIDSLAGLRFIWKKRGLRTLIIFGALVNLFGAPMQIFTSIFSKEVLHAGVTGYGYLEAAVAAGGLLGALISGKWSIRLQLWQWTFYSFVLSGGTLALIAVFHYLIPAVLLLGVSMAGIALVNIPLVTALQLLAPDDMRGRVMASFGLFFSCSMPIGLIAGGWLTNVFGPLLIFSGVGVLVIIMGVVSLFVPSLRDGELNHGPQVGGSQTSA